MFKNLRQCGIDQYAVYKLKSSTKITYTKKEKRNEK